MFFADAGSPRARLSRTMRDRRRSFRSLSDSSGDFFSGTNRRHAPSQPRATEPPIAAAAQPLRRGIPTTRGRRAHGRALSRSRRAQNNISARPVGTSARGQSRLHCSRPMPLTAPGENPPVGWRPWCSVGFRELGRLLQGWKIGQRRRISLRWRQLFNAIAAPSTDALKRSSWCRIRVTRSARCAELRWNRGWKRPTFPHTNLLNVRIDNRQPE